MTPDELMIWTMFATAALEPSCRDDDWREVSADAAAITAGLIADAMLIEWHKRAKQVKR